MLVALEVVRWICLGVLVVTTLYGLYHVVISVNMFGPPKRVQPTSDQTHRFAVVVCAKNEERVITHLLESLHDQHYPQDAFDVFVVADNCTDQTAAVSRASGAIVFERSDEVNKSKGHALNWFFPRFLADFKGRYDACVMFDADNVAAPDFLAAMNRQLNAGVRIATGYRMGKNPQSSWVAGASTMFWLFQLRTFHTPRSRWGLPCASLGGTGFMFDLSVLPNGTWHTESLCEDIEFTMNSIADGHFLGYAPDAVFYDEQPLTFMQSVHQRYRWALGNLQVVSISGPRLFKLLWRQPKQALDGFLFLVGGPTAAVSTIAGFVLSALTLALNPVPVVLVSMVAWTVLSYVVVAVFGWLILKLEHVSWPGEWVSIVTFPFYLLTWSLLAVAALFYRNTHWRDIPHVVSVGIQEIPHRRKGKPNPAS